MKLIYRFFLFHNIFVFIILKSSVLLAQDHFQVEIENTGISQLFIFEESIIGLDIGDEIGIFDYNGIKNYGNCLDIRDTLLLVGAGVWTGEQLAISAIGSINTCEYEGGYQTPGFVDSNAVIIKIWDSSIGIEYSTPVTFTEGDGLFDFDELSVAVISELQTYGGCKSSVALSCLIHADLFDDCITCPDIPCEGFYNPGASFDDGSCIYPTYGCRDSTALNYDPNATNSDGSCDYPPLIGIKIKNIDLENQTLEVWYNSPVTITSYQFSITGADILSIVGQDTLYETDGSLMGQVVFENSTGTFCLDAKAEDFTVLDYYIINLKASGCVSVITPELGGTVGSEGINVNIPAGALQQTAAIGIGGVTDELPQSVTNATGFQVGEIFAFTPFNLLFIKQVELTLPQQLSRIRGEMGLCILVDETDNTWDSFSVVCPDSSVDCNLKVRQTGIYALCVQKEDCNGDMGGDAFTDDCSECVGGHTGYEAKFTMDECNLCDGPGRLTWWRDQDEDGLGDPDNSANVCANVVPPNFVANSADLYPNCSKNYYDICNICDGDGTLCPVACLNDVPKTTFYQDVDGDTYGDPFSSYEFCSDPGANWVGNNEDIDDACKCSENNESCHDECTVCNGPGKIKWWPDDDGDSLGAGNYGEFCSDIDPGVGWVPNYSDPEPDCASNDTDYCGICSGSNDCIPQLDFTSLPAYEILPLKISSINLQFTVPLLPKINAVYLTSNYYELILDLDVNFNAASDEMQISFDQLTSGDTITLYLFSFQIVANVTNAVGEYEYNMGKVYDNYSWSYPIEYLGDYNHNGYIDTDDVEKLTEYWGGDTQYELGPCVGGPCKPIDVPNLTPNFDEKWDIEDLMAFILMYNYFARYARLAAAGSIENVGESPSLLFDKNILKMVLPQYNLPVHHIWIQVDISGSEVSFHPAAFSSQFDMALNRDFPEENAEQWSLIELDGIDLPKEFTLGTFQGSSRDGQSMEIQYKLTSKGHVLSSGSMALEYTSIPNNYELSPAYPNPFNPVVTVQYALPLESELVLSVYDVQGRLITYLDRGIKSAGYHESVWDGTQHASGMYFIRLNVYDLDNKLQFNKLQKIMLVK